MSFGLEDVKVIEEDENATEEQVALSLQKAINDRLWSLQGSYGRSMMNAIETGRCMLGLVSAKDYWGNGIPSRTQVQEGTKGSRQYVVDKYGEEWAKKLEGIE